MLADGPLILSSECLGLWLAKPQHQLVLQVLSRHGLLLSLLPADLSQKGPIFSRPYTHIRGIAQYMTERGCFHVSLSQLFCGVQIPLSKTVQREPEFHFLLCKNGAEVRKTWTVMVQRPASLRHGKHVGMELNCTCHSCLVAFGCSVL